MKPTVSDNVLRDAVLKELDSDPELSAKHIWVTAVDGAVTLGGHVATIHERHEAVRAAERVAAVRAIADDIEVRDPSSNDRADDEIAEEIAQLRGRNAHTPELVAAEVREGRVILHGRVESQSQRDAVERAARQLAGVRAVDDLIQVDPQTDPPADDVERRVREAIMHTADLDAGSIRVTLTDGTARLRGRLPSVAALQAALEAAERAPGVTAVESEIVVTSHKSGYGERHE